MSDFLEHVGTKELMLLANNLRKEYNKKRELWYHDATRYFHQAIASSYCSEESLATGIQECQDIKNRYNEVCDILKSRGCHPAIGDRWIMDNVISKLATV